MKPGMILRLEKSSWPVAASNAHKVALPVGVLARSCEVSRRPPLSTCRTFSPFDKAKITPFAISTGSGTDRSREIQAGSSTGFPSFVTTRNAITLPSGASPCVMGNFGAS